MPKKKPPKPEPVTLSPWRQVVVDARAPYAEPLEGVLLEEGALGIERIDDTTRSMPGRPVAPTGQVTLVAPFSREAGLEARVVAELGRVATLLEAEGVGEARLEVHWNDLWPEDWNAAFKAEWKPIAISKRMWVCPSWEEGFTPPMGASALFMDPGLAFGTGTHQTTRLCARAIDTFCRVDPPQRLLDVGTGTGVLALTALKLGVERATGTDIDPVAVRAAADNARKNLLADRFTAREGPPDVEGAVWPAVVANILAGPLLDLAGSIHRALAPGGRLWLSGVLQEQEQSVLRGYLDLGLAHLGTEVEDGWVRIDLQKP